MAEIFKSFTVTKGSHYSLSQYQKEHNETKTPNLNKLGLWLHSNCGNVRKQDKSCTWEVAVTVGCCVCMQRTHVHRLHLGVQVQTCTASLVTAATDLLLLLLLFIKCHQYLLAPTDSAAKGAVHPASSTCSRRSVSTSVCAYENVGGQKAKVGH